MISNKNLFLCVILFSSLIFSKDISIPYDFFNYNLGVKVIHVNDHSEVTICCHGYGHCNKIVESVAAQKLFAGQLIGFNFSDYGITPGSDHNKSKYGTIDELLPLMYLMKYCACNLSFRKLNLYGFSAGGGAIINVLAILNQSSYKEQLEKIGIFPAHAKMIITALKQGQVVLDCPLKSMDEIIAVRGKTNDLEIIASHYNQNKLNPIENLELLQGLKLSIILNFQNPDEVIGNRDDTLFIERLRKYNKGNTIVIISSNGGHNDYHADLWKYLKIISH